MEPKHDERIRTALTHLAGATGVEMEVLFEQVYRELREIASAYLRRERADHTLQPTALVHEAYLKMLGGRELQAENAAHFRAIAARVMRQLLVEHARGRNAIKRGGDGQKITLASHLTPVARASDGIDLLALEEALEHMASLDPRMVEVVELRFYGGFTIEETAAQLGISATVVKSDWRMARALITKFVRDDG